MTFRIICWVDLTLHLPTAQPYEADTEAPRDDAFHW